MIPLKDENPISTTPIVVYLLIAINIAVFFQQLSLGEQLNNFFQLYAVIPQELTASLTGNPPGQSVPEWFTLISSQFLHGGFLHIGFNMLYLWIFGNNIEDSLGHVKFIIFYLVCGVLAGLTHWFFGMESLVPTIGASGAIAGVMGAYVIKYPKAKILTLLPLGIFITTIRIPAIFFLGFWFLQQAISSFASLGMEAGGGVAYWAHAGGFVFGVIVGPMLGLFSKRRR
ncbi:putative membrane protein [Xenococcus sp. PCC 7305]|uniref:rhomboid family intramembrane serine protease n=1 Tax=Xenococcus sp. PCC 7305 TaxID=102125 RepID=UPI0002AC5D7C|nr:rhomboid family intramembrane serine protease [Xenococcus sp. PCC 7305]ELS05431.1 putative membrane protein [Xenococcus sp. PCC 7305]